MHDDDDDAAVTPRDAAVQAIRAWQQNEYRCNRATDDEGLCQEPAKWVAILRLPWLPGGSPATATFCDQHQPEPGGVIVAVERISTIRPEPGSGAA